MKDERGTSGKNGFLSIQYQWRSNLSQKPDEPNPPAPKNILDALGSLNPKNGVFVVRVLRGKDIEGLEKEPSTFKPSFKLSLGKKSYELNAPKEKTKNPEWN